MNIKELILTLNGRIGRKTYLVFFVIMLLISVFCGIIQSVLGLDQTVYEENGQVIYNTGAIIFNFITNSIITLIFIAPSVKRLHDVDKSGWFYLLILVPFVNLWIIYLLFFKKGTVGENRFGNDPITKNS